MLDRADCADFGCHNSIRLETKHFLNTLALTFISFSGRFVFAMQKHYLFFFCERSCSFYLIFQDAELDVTARQPALQELQNVAKLYTDELKLGICIIHHVFYLC